MSYEQTLRNSDRQIPKDSPTSCTCKDAYPKQPCPIHMTTSTTAIDKLYNNNPKHCYFVTESQRYFPDCAPKFQTEYSISRFWNNDSNRIDQLLGPDLDELVTQMLQLPEPSE